MASVMAYVINFGIRAIIKWRLETAGDAMRARKIFNVFPSIPPRGVRFIPASLGAPTGEWALSKSPDSALTVSPTTLFYLHGGAFIAMSAQTHRAITGGFAKRGFQVYAPNYRLAPEHPFPAALEDALAAWRALRAAVDGPIFLAGDSAGGNLSLALTMHLRDLGEPCPAAVVLFSPWTDMTASGSTYITNAKSDALLPSQNILKASEIYLGGPEGVDPRTPLASPLFGEYAGLPPLYFFVGDREILLDDSRMAVEKAKKANTEAYLDVWPVVPHAWPYFGQFLPEAQRTLDIAAAFFRNKACQGIEAKNSGARNLASSCL